MDKVKITREQANEIEEQKKMRVNVDILEEYEIIGNLPHCDKLDKDTFIKALYIGYEVEETPEDKVREYYNSGKRGVFDEEWDADGYQRALGVVETLRLLNIKIEGVNA